MARHSSGGALARVGAALMVVGALAVAAALLTFTRPGLREVGFVLVGGVTSPRGALIGGTVLIGVGVLLRRRAQRARGG